MDTLDDFNAFIRSESSARRKPVCWHCGDRCTGDTTTREMGNEVPVCDDVELCEERYEERRLKNPRR